MEQKNYAGQVLEVTEEGYLLDSSKWNKEVAIDIAKEEGIELSDTHFEVLNYIRKKVENEETLTIRAIGKSGIVDIKGFYGLFPGAPLKNATRIAGVPKPSSCV
ncbi:TusE/DsrC/DsvC family sulfur relay protein [candidate division KSB1 bacterium]